MRWWINKISVSGLCLIAFTLIYALILLWMSLVYAEPWRDIAHIWVFNRDGTWWDVFTTIPANSHPFVWILLVKLLTISGFSYQSSVVFNAIICILAIILFVTKGPFPWWFKIACIFSYPFFYEFPLPGRTYTPGVLLMFVIAFLYKDRHRRPILYCTALALLMHTHFLFLSLCLPVAALFSFEGFRQKTLFQKNNLIGLSLLVLSALYFYWYLLQVNQYSELLNVRKSENTLLDIFSIGLTTEKIKYNILILFTLLALFIHQARKAIPFIITVLSMAFLIYVYHNILPDFMRYYQIIPPVLLSVMWIFLTHESKDLLGRINDQKKETKTQSTNSSANYKRIFNYMNLPVYLLFAACMILSGINASKALLIEKNKLHSDAKNTADFIVKNKLLNYQIVGHRSYTASSIVPYLPKDKMIWYADRQEFGTYLLFDSAYHLNNIRVSYSQAIANALNYFKNEKKLLLVLSIQIPQEYLSQFNLIYTSKEIPIQQDEFYFIYVRR